MNKFLKFVGLFIAFWAVMLGFGSMMQSENETVIMIGIAVGFILTILFIVWLIRVAILSVKNAPSPVSTELLTTETVGIGRGASAAIGSFLGGNLGMFAGAVGGGRKQYATFLVTYSDGSIKTEQVKVNSLRYMMYMELRNK